jgi:hypothetical protein
MYICIFIQHENICLELSLFACFRQPSNRYDQEWLVLKYSYISCLIDLKRDDMIRKSTDCLLVYIKQFAMIIFYTPNVIKYHIYNSYLHVHWNPVALAWEHVQKLVQVNIWVKKDHPRSRCGMARAGYRLVPFGVEVGLVAVPCVIFSWSRSRFSSCALYHI